MPIQSLLTKQKNVECTVRFTMHADGKVTNIQLAKTCGSRELDDIALKALQAASPWGAFPDSVKRRTITSEITFSFIR